MAYNTIDFENDITELDEDNMNHLDLGIKNSYNVPLIAISNTAPSQCSTGDKYYNTTSNEVFTATANNTWGATGETPLSDILYVVFATRSIYTYNGVSLISVGGNPNAVEPPIGSSQDYWGATDPNANWLIMDGRAISRTDYSELFAILGTTFGDGDGSTTFNIPKHDGLITVGLDANDTDFDTVGKTGGSKALQKHRHGVEYSTDGGTTWADGAIGKTGAYTGTYYMALAGTSVVAFSTYQARIKETGTGDSGNLQPYIVCNKIIRVK